MTPEARPSASRKLLHGNYIGVKIYLVQAANQDSMVLIDGDIPWKE